MKGCRRVALIATVVGAVAGISYALSKRRAPHLVAEPEGVTSFTHPVLIINPHSGGGKAQKIGLAATAQGLGIEIVIREKGQKIGKLAHTAVDNGCDHLIVAGGDGSLARVAKVAIERGIPFSCVPSGTRNHFAMDLGLDRNDPAKALDTAFDGVQCEVDVGRIGKHLFLNNVSFGIYADAIAEDGYRQHKSESMLDAARGDIEDGESSLSVRGPDGVTHDRIDVLLASNNPYQFIGLPDFAGRARLDAGTLGVILADRPETGDFDLGHSEVKRWTTPKVTVDSTKKKVHIGIDGSLHKMHAPVDIRIDPRALTVVLSSALVEREIAESHSPDHEALSALSGPSS